MNRNFKYLLIATVSPLLLHTSALAQETATPTTASDQNSWIYTVMAFFFMFIFIFGAVVFGRLGNLTKEENEEAFSFKKWWADLNSRVLTKAVSVEKEQEILLDHDYDGIKELDNSLPPWWKYGFYFTILVGVIYLLRFHVFHSGPTPEEEYNKEMRVAAAQIDEYRKKSNDMVDEKTVTMGDRASIERGQKIFSSNCFACHGAKGEGGVGPNLTDDYWLHGGTINEVFRTIKYGVPEKGMQSWEKTYSPAQIKDLASFVKSLKGTNPPNAKAPQGDPVSDATAAVVKDSTNKN
jgi:cytochrome c oxidase cbb3-type subunit 3